MFMQLNSMIWNYKKGKSLSLASAVSGLCIPSELKAFEKEITSMHKIGVITYDTASVKDFEKLSENYFIKL
jgi:hypothetical protein